MQFIEKKTQQKLNHQTSRGPKHNMTAWRRSTPASTRRGYCVAWLVQVIEIQLILNHINDDWYMWYYQHGVQSNLDTDLLQLHRTTQLRNLSAIIYEPKKLYSKLNLIVITFELVFTCSGSHIIPQQTSRSTQRLLK